MTQATVDVVRLFSVLPSLEPTQELVEAVAERFSLIESVEWSEVGNAGVSGQDLIRLRQLLNGKVRLLIAVRSVFNP